MSTEKEVVIWIAGLLSTDGQVNKPNKNYSGLGYLVHSSENDWIKIIETKLKLVGIICSIKRREGKTVLAKNGYQMFQLYIYNPRKITLLFDKYDVESFFNPRKWKRVKLGIEYYKSSPNRSQYTPNEDIIIKNLNLSCKEAANLLVNRSIDGVWRRRERLGLIKKKRTWNNIPSGRKQMKRKCRCIDCGKTIYRFPSQITGNVFCSKKCFNEFRKKIGGIKNELPLERK